MLFGRLQQIVMCAWSKQHPGMRLLRVRLAVMWLNSGRYELPCLLRLHTERKFMSLVCRPEEVPSMEPVYNALINQEVILHDAPCSVAVAMLNLQELGRFENTKEGLKK
jgi:hypothetical protein